MIYVVKKEPRTYLENSLAKKTKFDGNDSCPLFLFWVLLKLSM